MNMSSLDNFVMVAKDQEAVDALIQLKGLYRISFSLYRHYLTVRFFLTHYVWTLISLPVRDNSSPGIYQAVRRDLTKLRTFRMEYDIGTVCLLAHFMLRN
jgi:hypothetical protein